MRAGALDASAAGRQFAKCSPRNVGFLHFIRRNAKTRGAGHKGIPSSLSIIQSPATLKSGD